jgi:predicted peroxiredoxin
MPKLLITSATGPADPVRASLPFHIAGNGGPAAGVDCVIALAGEATGVLVPGVAEGIHGLGFAPLVELMAKCKTAGIPIHV